MSKLVIGLTIVAMGTSSPEAAISISAAVKGSADIAVGNVLGSNILNVLVILGLTAVITPLAVHKTTVKYEIPFVFFITVIFALIGLRDKVLGRVDGAVLWVLFIAYLFYLYYMSKKQRPHKKHKQDVPEEEPVRQPLWKLILLFLVGLGLIIFGSNIAVDAATTIAEILGVSQRIIGLTIVAFGTSLPELVMTVNASKKGEHDLAVGNIIGTNIFNICVVLGLPTLLFGGFTSAAFNFADTLVVLLAAIMYYLCSRSSKKLTRIEGIMMVMIFAAYYTYVFIS